MKSRLPVITFVLILIATALAVFGYVRNASKDQDNTGEINREAILSDARKSGLIMDETEIARMENAVVEKPASAKFITDVSPYKDLTFNEWRSGALADVTGGGSFGLAHSRFANGTYTLVSIMGGLLPVSDNAFYEGWLVKRGDTPRMISIGPVVTLDERAFSILTANEDLTSFDFFVLTLETNDANPKPGKHILEGTLQ